VPYGYFLVQDGQERRFQVPGCAEDRTCLARFLQKGIRRGDLGLMFHDLEQFEQLLEVGLREGWLVVATPTISYSVVASGGKPCLVLGAKSRLLPKVDACLAEGDVAAGEEPLLELGARYEVERVLYLADGCGWCGLDLMQSVVLPRYRAMVGLGLGTELIFADSIPRVPLCIECLLRWSLGNSHSPAERTRWLRFLAAETASSWSEAPTSASGLAARHISAFLEGSDQTRGIFKKVSSDQELFRVLGLGAHPSCSREHARGHAKAGTPAEPPVDTAGMVPRLKRHAMRVGIIKDFEIASLGDVDVGDYFLARGAINTSFASRAFGTIHCFGDAATEEMATLKCIAEASERIALFHYSPDSFHRARRTDLHGETLAPEAFQNYAAEQYATPGFPFARFDAQGSYLWTRMADVSSGEERWIPAEFVYSGCRRGTGPLYQASSVGSAAHFEPERARLSALLEVAERDSLAITFLANIPLPHVREEDLGGIQTARERMRADGFELYFLELTLDIEVPAVLVLGHRDGSAPYFLKGAAAGLTTAQAAEKAFGEAWRSYLFYRKWPARLLTDVRQTNPGSPEYNLALYQSPRSREKLAFLRSERTTERRLSLAGFADVLAAFQRAGLSVFERDCTPGSVLATGLRCVRTFVPGTLTTSLGNAPACLGVPRLYEVPRLLGHRSQNLRISEVNREPHFFS
jgi:ribosomal protein S12 methylthiotransferase accessory factor